MTERGPSLPRWLREVGWRTFVGALLLAGIIHIAATLAIPMLGPGNAFARLRDSLPANRMVILPPPAPGKEPLPFLTPDALYGICRYDVSVDSLGVSAALLHPGWTLSLHTPQGDNFYVMPAQPMRRGGVELVVVPGASGPDEFNPIQRRIGAQGTHIASPSMQGLVVVRAPLRGLAWRAEAEAALRSASCAPVKR